MDDHSPTPTAPASTIPAPPVRADGFWSTVASALRGAQRDYTTGPIPRALLLLAVPMVIEMSMESLFAVVDVFWVSRLGSSAVAVVGLTESMLALVYALAMGLSMAAAATVARRIGEKDRDGAAIAAVQVIALGLLIALPLGFAGGGTARHLLAVMGAAPETVANGGGYTVVMLGGNATILLLFLMNSLFRGAGDATIAMRTLWLANGLNLVLDPCLIFGWGPFPEMGVAGAAVATNIGRGIGVLFQLCQLLRGRGQLRVERRHLQLAPAPMASIVRLSGAGIVQSLIGTASWLGLVRVLARFGDAALAGYTIGMRVVIFGLLPSWGMANAAATMVGQGLGAKDPERAERSVWLASRYNLFFLGAIGLFFVLGAPWIVAFFTTEPEVARYAVGCLRTVSYGFIFFAYGMVLAQAFNGAGDPWTATWINLGCFWFFEIPLAIVLANHTPLGPHGVFWSIFASFSLFTVVSAWLFKRGRWKTKKV